MSDIINVLGKKVIDNRKISMVDAFHQLLPVAEHVDIAVGYFLLSGFETLEESVTEFMERGGTMRILMGRATDRETGRTIDEGYKIMAQKLLLQDIKNTKKTSGKLSVIQKVRRWVAESKIDIKIYTGDANYFHAKSYLFYRMDKNNPYDGISIVGSSNFTKNGLMGNTELNVLSMDNFYALTQWFFEIWNGSEVTDFSKELLEFIDREVPEIFEEAAYLHPKDTYLTFARYFAKTIPEEIEGEFMKTLYKHQKQGVTEIKYRLDKFGTAILADGVGLGKTRTAAASAMAVRAKNILILAPKKLHDQWRQELKTAGVVESCYRLVGKEEFSRYGPESLEKFLDADLIIVDEAHQGLKNDRTKLYRNLSYIKKRCGEKVKGLLITATPWNNSRSDVFHLGRLFLNIKNVPPHAPYYSYLFHSTRKAEKAFEEDDKAFKAFWRDLFLQRTKRTYGGNDVKYAERRFPVVEIHYEPQKSKAFLANGERIANLHLPYMNPIRYIKGSNEEEFTAERLKLLFLKRADSSWKAFKDTLENVKQKLQELRTDLLNISRSADLTANFKDWLRRYYQLDIKERYQGLFEEMDEEELNDFFNTEHLSLEIREKQRIRLDNRIQSITPKMAQKMLRDMLKHAEKDLVILNDIISELDNAFARKDEKYEKVRDTALNYLKQGKKVLLVSQFRSTVLDYYKRFINEKEMESFRMAQVTGNKDDCFVGLEHWGSKEKILEMFSPRSKNQGDIRAEDEIQLLIGTETISVGQNLQDCRVLMNLDLPYNPMVLEQRIGRIDRPRDGDEIGYIDIITFPSMPVIESELKLSKRLEQKLKRIYMDTKFDDLVLPEYREFLERVLKQREVEERDVEAMVDSAIQSALVKIEAEEHSSEYLESQLRMRKAIEENREIHPNPAVKHVSFSKGKENHSLVAKVCLRDVNGKNIDEYFIHVSVNDKDRSVFKELAVVEKNWHESGRNPILYKTQLPVSQAKEKLELMKEFLRKTVLREEVNHYNHSIETEIRVNENLIDRKIKKVIISINDQIRGRNRGIIANKIKEAGYDPKSVKTLIDHLQFIDKKYDIEEMELVDELYEDIDKLWENYRYYFEKLVGGIQIDLVPQSFSVRKADYEKSGIEWVVGNIVIS